MNVITFAASYNQQVTGEILASEEGSNPWVGGRLRNASPLGVVGRVAMSGYPQT